MIKKTSLRISALSLALLLLFAAAFTVFAVSASVVDDSANVFTAEQRSELQSRLDRTADKTGWQMIVYTSDKGIASDLNSYYNANYYDTHNYDANAVVLVYDVGSNKGTVITHGDAMNYISDQRMSSLGQMLRLYLDEQNYYQGAIAFADKIDQYYSEGIPEDDTFDNISYEEKSNKFLYSLTHYGWICGLLGVAAALIFFFVNKSRYKNMGKSGTYDLAANSSVDLKEQQDDFVTQHTTVRTIERDSSSSGGSSGGGSTHGGGDF